MVGIIDVGGGTRGIYGAGVLDYCMDAGIAFPYFIGVSAGAANGVSYLAGQRGRNLVFYDEYFFRKEYISLGLLFQKGSMLDLDYVYGTLSNSDGEYPVDYEAFMANSGQIEIVSMNARTGEAVYFQKKDIAKDHWEFLKASCAVPVVCKPYPIGNELYYDGGLIDPIPYRHAFASGCDALVIILTKPKHHLRTAGRDRFFSHALLRYPAARAALQKRSVIYNQELKEILDLETAGKVLIIAPDDIGSLKTLSKDHRQLESLYQKGFHDAEAIPEFLKRWN